MSNTQPTHLLLHTVSKLKSVMLISGLAASLLAPAALAENKSEGRVLSPSEIRALIAKPKANSRTDTQKTKIRVENITPIVSYDRPAKAENKTELIRIRQSIPSVTPIVQYTRQITPELVIRKSAAAIKSEAQTKSKIAILNIKPSVSYDTKYTIELPKPIVTIKRHTRRANTIRLDAIKPMVTYAKAADISQEVAPIVTTVAVPAQKMAERAPKSAKQIKSMARIEKDMARAKYSSVIRRANRHLKKYNDDVEALSLAALASAKTYKFEEAAEFLKKAQALAPNHKLVLASEGVMHIAHGRFGAGADSLKKIRAQCDSDSNMTKDACPEASYIQSSYEFADESAPEG